MRALVTGAAGFLGSHLVDRLLADGASEVIGLDDLSTGSRDNLRHLAGERRFRFVEHDVTVPYDFAVDRIFNLACPASPPKYQRDAVKTTLTSVMGVHHGLLVARRHRARFVQASTSEVYGDPEVHPQREEYRGSVNPIGPRACYDEGKRCAESLVMDFRRQYGVDARVARIFNTYGPRMALDDGRVVSNFVAQCLRGQPLTVFGDGTQTRSFCYVTDLVGGLVALMSHPSEAGPVNLGNPTEFTMLELADLVRQIVGSSVPLQWEPLPRDDPKQRRPDITRARLALGFEPTIPLRAGLELTIADFRRRADAPPR